MKAGGRGPVAIRGHKVRGVAGERLSAEPPARRDGDAAGVRSSR